MRLESVGEFILITIEDGVLASSDGEETTLRGLSQIEILRKFGEFPWRDHAPKSDADDRVSMLSLSRGDEGYLNLQLISCNEFFMQIEVFLPKKIFGILPGKKAAYGDGEGCTMLDAELLIKNFTSYKVQDLFDWVERGGQGLSRRFGKT